MDSLVNTIMLDSFVLIKPSNKLREFIKQLKVKDDMPPRLESIIGKKKLNADNFITNGYVTATKDFEFVSTMKKELNDENVSNESESESEPELTSVSDEIKTFSTKDKNDGYLQVEDLLWLNKELELQRQNGKNVYLHELLKDSSIYVPENEKMERSLELVKRCARLKIQQDNLRYRNMTKNVDSVRLREPEESIAYQVQQINKQLIAVGQFIISVLAGFAFGFIGVELMIGNLDFGFRLLLGIMCALTIALAELYFLAKQLASE